MTETHTITVQKTIEVDLDVDQREELLQRTGKSTTRGAVEQFYLDREANAVAPEEKLLNLEVNDDEPPHEDDA